MEFFILGVDRKPIQETVGMLDLKIAQLERRSKLLKQQQSLSRAYPIHQAKLIRQDSQVQSQLNQLIQRREELIRQCNQLNGRGATA
jgi:hypothetical protein